MQEKKESSQAWIKFNQPHLFHTKSTISKN